MMTPTHHTTQPHIPDNYRLKAMTISELMNHRVTTGMEKITE
jgi:hypothetical protein